MQAHRTHCLRRAVLTACLPAWLLAGCATQPAPVKAPAAPPVDARSAALHNMGFRWTEAGWTFDMVGRLLFETDSDRLDAEHQAIAERLGRGLRELGVDRLRIEGHTDDVGSAAYNQGLSLRRARAVARALAAAGLQDAKIEVVGLGKSMPVADNRTAESRLQNRRVAVIVPAQ